MFDVVVLARIAYAAYSRSTGYRTSWDEPMPEWDALTPAAQRAWKDAMSAVVNFLIHPANRGGR